MRPPPTPPTAAVAVALVRRKGHLMPGSHDEAADLLDAYLARADCGSTVAHPEQTAV
jgi:hypothetical protein